MFNQEKNNVGAKNMLPVQHEKNILTQEQIAQMLQDDELDYTLPEVLINDFLFRWNNDEQNYEKVLDVVFMNYFKSRPYFTMYDMDEQQMHEAYHFLTMLCRNRKLLVQIATDKGIINPRKENEIFSTKKEPKVLSEDEKKMRLWAVEEIMNSPERLARRVKMLKFKKE